MTARSRRRRRRWLLAALVGVLAAAGAATAATVSLRDAGPTTPAASTATGVTEVRRTTLVDAAVVDGRLDHGPEAALATKATGTVTWLPAPGTTLRRGDVVARVDDKPVVLLYGDLPAYRDLAPAGTDRAPGAPGVGRDVRQLEANLRELGHLSATPDDVYGPATKQAVERWQESLGRARTGTVAQGDVVYAPGPLRVSRVTAAVGAAAPTEVLKYTTTERLVVARAAVGETAWAAPRAKVDIVLPDGRVVRGTVRSVGTDVGEPVEGENGPRVEVVVTVDDERALGGIGSAPVTVRYVARTRADVLAVPVTALVALAEGGYGLELADRPPGTFVAVTTGMFAGGQVEVSGPGVQAGLRVRIPV